MRRFASRGLSVNSRATVSLPSRSSLVATRMTPGAMSPFHVSSKSLQSTVSVPSTTTSYPTNHDKVEPVETPYFINNRLVNSTTNKFIDLHDPKTNHLVTRVPELTDSEMKAAVASAEKVFESWSKTTVLTRQQIIFRFVQLIRDNFDRLGASCTFEQGKTLADARGDVLRGIQVAEAAIAASEFLKGELLEVSKEMETRTYLEPLGVVAAIVPFNFPATVPLWGIPIATITGNTMILKPSERDPGAGMILAELIQKAGFPRRFISGNNAGKYIYTRGSANGKRVQANLGAKNHAAVLPDANKNHFFNSVVGVGEIKEWLPEIVEQAKRLKVDGGFEQGAELGTVISPQSKDRIEKLIESAEREGATILLDGRRKGPSKYPNVNWISPTVIADVTTDMTCYKEENFGPVLICLYVDMVDDAIDLIHKNEYGNGTAVFTSSFAYVFFKASVAMPNMQ
ncbi:hypothetical protein NM208_g4212 [Fusarium decemcellulare]|uniref:Uncharacterized protein n=1 Tax=Fusarium decemcellulare TaxID=57161 RepID=A0ACC1SLF6_9HYPO|nr:hypothetical protein NM208_g4212 [Fusarium decemcellulare]